ncbi:hypothetical protein AB1282_03015 [Gottfriedia sp. S16(2024)]|uniref:hypothetical protein n=1 Tax=Gottfriedia sp. S16(2024) TaxID=3162883 RepID=UPI003D1C625B
MDKGNVSKSLKRLCQKQFIAKIENGYMINPHLFYIGKSHSNDRYELREEFDTALTSNNIQPRFSMNEDMYKLTECQPNSVEESSNTTEYNSSNFPF